MNTPKRLLFIGDLHLGRVPRGFKNKTDKRDLRPALVWNRAVSLALERQVLAVLLGGDIVDRDAEIDDELDRFNAGLSKLQQAGIPVYTVTGNHDFSLSKDRKYLPGSESCRIIGEDESWERVGFASGEGTPFYVDGWSYARPGLDSDPLEQHQFLRANGRLLGLLHAEVHRTTERTDRVALSELKKTPHEAWLLGHMHQPRFHSKNPLVLEGGLAQPLEPRDTGKRGAWIIEAGENQQITASLIPLMSVLYRDLTLHVETTGKETSPAKLLFRQVKKELASFDNKIPAGVEALGLNLEVRAPASVTQKINESQTPGEELRNRLHKLKDEKYELALTGLETRAP